MVAADVTTTVRVTLTVSVTDECTACGACLLTCPEHAFVPTIPLTVNERCTGCGECVEICPRDALVLT